MKQELEQLDALLSRWGDGDLTPDELSRVEQHVAASAEAGKARLEYDRLAELLRNWRTPPAALDWQTFQRSVTDAIAEDLAERGSSVVDRSLDAAALGEDSDSSNPYVREVARQMSRTDALVQRHQPAMPEVDWTAFRSRVSAAVEQEARQSGMHVAGRSRVGGVLRWFVPLAAAAVIAIAVFRTGPLPGTKEVQPAQAPMILVALDLPVAAGRIQFSFDEAPAPEDDSYELPGTAIAKSSAPARAEFDDAELMY